MSMIFNGINLVKELEFSISSQELSKLDLHSIRRRQRTAENPTCDHWFNFRYPVMQTVEGNDTSRPRHRRRKKDIGEEETVLVAAVERIEFPPDDNYTWE
ncbi:hypothetical protein ISN44_As10g025350 [Arabidopsis suecica]|uniref:Uncharacterized protein n=1 Tax=Arabidopsis suecica TaxID=45249 RepID=A0A8T1ZYZ7_ARASU|nr:hypothetical protein ISN44_As10g025350 [Arabidopsis suecica]